MMHRKGGPAFRKKHHRGHLLVARDLRARVGWAKTVARRSTATSGDYVHDILNCSSYTPCPIVDGHRPPLQAAPSRGARRLPTARRKRRGIDPKKRLRG